MGELSLEGLCANPLDTSRHLNGCSPGKRHEQYPAWVCSMNDQMCDAMRQGVCLTRSGAGNYEEGPTRCGISGSESMLYSAALFGIKLLQMCGHKIPQANTTLEHIKN